MISGVEPPGVWTHTSLVLELTIPAAAAVAAVLTAGTLIQAAGGTTRLVDPQTAALAWVCCMCLVGGAKAVGRRIPPDTVARHRRPLVFLLAAALIWIALGVLRPSIDAANGLVGEYFGNPDWNGEPTSSVVDREPSTAGMRERWGPLPPDQFSVRWAGFLTVGRSGSYNFATTSDDGSQLIIDNRLVVDNTGPHSSRTRSGSINLEGGSYPVVLRYVQYGAVSRLDVTWSRDADDFSPVPAWVWSQHRTNYATVLGARIVEWGLWSFTMAIVLLAAWYVRVGLSGEAVGRWAVASRLAVTESYRNTASLAFSALVLAAILYMPWESGGQFPFFKSVEGTVRTLNGTALTMLGRFDALQRDINNPNPDESILPARVQDMLRMLRGHGVDEYQLSDAIVADSWVFQQMVASAWPRKLEKDAKARFVLDGEPERSGCRLIDRQRDVSLVYCP